MTRLGPSAPAALGLAAGLSLLFAGRGARADGAFPDELEVFAPASAPQSIVLGANYGAVQSSDDGQTWQLVCEGMISGPQLVTQYQLGPDGSLFAIYAGTVARSSDQGCTWTDSNAIPGSLAQDLFVDPLSANNVWLIADGFQAGAPNALYLSTDGGASFGAPAYVEPSGYLNGVEAAHTEGVVLVSGFTSSPDGGTPPYLLSSQDLGATWTQHLHPELGPRIIGIAQVDPNDDATAYLRLSGTGLDALAITTDRGATVTVLLELNEVMSAFALGGDGTLYVGAKSGHLWVRAPGATAFTLGNGPMFRCLAERAGTLYACGDDVLDGYALGVSTDHGATFQSLLETQDIDALVGCASVARQCTVPLQNLLSIIDSVVPTSSSSSGGTTGTNPGGKESGCGCGEGGGATLGLLLALALLRRASRSREGRA